MRWTIPVLLFLCSSLAGAWGRSANRRVEEDLHAGILDTATAVRLQEILSDPASSPDEISAGLLERIPGMDAECAQRLRRLERGSLRSDTLEAVLGSRCHEAIDGYLRTGADHRSSGAFSIRSSSLIDTVPQWKRDLQGMQRAGPAQGQLHWSPDRSSPWVHRRFETSLGSSRIQVGDLQGWREAEDLWNRPSGKTPPSRSFLEGSGAWINGAQVRASADSLELRAAFHRRDSALALAAGIGGFGQFLSVASGQDSGRRWLGTQVQGTIPLDGTMISLQPAWSRSGPLDNRSLRTDVAGRSGPLAWKGWGSWNDDEFLHPLAPSPTAATALGKAFTFPIRSGGLSLDRSDSLVKWHASATSIADARDHALTQCLLRANHAADGLQLEASTKVSMLSRPDTAMLRSWQFLQSARNAWGDWTPRFRLQEDLDSSGVSADMTPGFSWKPFRQWSLEVWVRQFLDEPTRRESSVSTRIAPVRHADIVTEILYRQGMLRSDEERWYIRLEGSSRW